MRTVRHHGVSPWFAAGRRPLVSLTLLIALAAGIFSGISSSALAQSTGPTMLAPNLAVRQVVGGLTLPIGMAFLGANDMLVIEKASGKVMRVTRNGNQVVQATVLDLAVNSASERGLLGIALHPNFPANPGIYLFWTESTTGADSTALAETPLLGNRVDRFVWDGSALTFDRTLIRLRAFQQDANQPLRGNPRRWRPQVRA